ncbi:capsular polysaccharide biosynthesis protein [Virgibacillus pantothenticus]|uniref:YveK family protein n=1 Tax=Virgibacillus TaxID=84406 RepID=UPI000909A49F|nr:MULTISPECIES: Wzz/FepE/Etk N-terminal domain-containing protein [Virgibacillus]API92964.1 capsular biosynthesis protein [Virgibacillus sp. 6R]MBS7428487.1 capsular biosynthesis protein [Virgibacillus sp. 19R1-5]GIP62958.1 capsular polysaccharide biosynthesis protein [Virgibacillus pantothenticus]
MEETISLKEIFAVLKKRIKLILACIFGAAVIAAIVSYFVLTPTYEANSSFIVNQSQQDSQTQYNVDEIRTNVELINTYNVIIKSARILNQVVDELNLDMTSDELAQKIQVSSEEQSQVVTVTATDSSPELAVEMANTTVTTFQNEIPELMNVDNVNILSEAELEPNPSPVSPNSMLNIAIAIVLGAMIGVGIAFLLEYLDNTITSEEDVEKQLGTPVLGTISSIQEKDISEQQFRPQPSNQERGTHHVEQKKSV